MGRFPWLSFLCFDASELCIDFTGTLAGGSTVFLSVKSLFRIVMAEPLIPRCVELATVDPQISVRTWIGAQFTQFARSFTTAARRALLVRTTQTFHVIAYRAVITNVVVKVFWMFDGRPSARSLGRPRPFIRSVWTFGETASDLMRCGPHHLRVMPNLEQIILRRAVRKVVFFQEPRFRGKHPWNLMSRYENVLPARPKVVDPSAGDIVVDQELALIRPALSVSSRFAVPSHR